MKNLLFFSSLLLIFNLSLHAEETENNQLSKNKEIKLNLPTTILGHFLELSYEHILNTDFSLGSAVGINLDSSDFFPNFIIAPFVRWFFGGNRRSMNHAGSGFFIEANTAFNNYEKENNYNSNYQINKNEYGFGLGIAIGWKYLSSNNWSGEIVYGCGRNLGNNYVYPRVGISIGKRF